MPVLALPPIDEARKLATSQLDANRRAELGQYMTPSAIANFMASLFQKWPDDVRLLDPGAGVGSLTDSFASAFFDKAAPGARLDISAYEIDGLLNGYLTERLEEIAQRGNESGFSVSTEIKNADFVVDGSFAASFAQRKFTHVILNPPYKKIGASSQHRKLLQKAGIDTVNLYSAFLALAVALAEDEAEIVAIVPRSFCNGRYFRPFREWLLDRVALTHIHIFESRKKAFKDDDVLQENIIIRLVRSATQAEVVVSTSHDSNFSDYLERSVPFGDVVKPFDKERYIHVPTIAAKESKLFSRTLAELGLSVSTGPVVDFRVRSHWLDNPTDDSAPLLYTHHFANGKLVWPRQHKKPNALSVNEETRKWLLPRGWYVLTKRFSSKEERRRIVSYTIDPNDLPYPMLGFENHLNVIHADKRGLPMTVARGLSLFLNSTLVDEHFRGFSGHTQVNATDLRNMRFPDLATLEEFGDWAVKQEHLSQEKIDYFVRLHAF